MAVDVPPESPKKISEFSHHPRLVAINLKFPAKNTKEIGHFRHFFHKIFCFGHNFLTDAIFSNPLSQAIYIFPVLHIDTFIGHIYGQNDPYENGHSDYFVEIGLYGRLCIISFFSISPR